MLKWFVCIVITVVPALGSAQMIVCSGKIISEGVSQAEVSAKCGTPAQVDSRGSFSDDVKIEIWTYNFGPNKFMERIRFEDGIVTRVEALGYGF